MVTLEFTEKQILGLLPAEALLDFDRAKEVLEKVVKAQSQITREEILREVGARLLTFSKNHTQFDRCTMELLVDADLFLGFRDTLLKGEMPD